MKSFHEGITVKALIRLGFILLSLVLIIFFVRHERTELAQVGNILINTRIPYVMAGILFAGIYVLLQGGMNYYSFQSIHHKISFFQGTRLFLRRNFISAFIPGGNITSQVFFTKEFEAVNITKTEIHFASLIFILSGFITIIIITIPAVIFLSVLGGLKNYEIYAFALTVVITVFIIMAIISLYRNGLIYRLLHKYLPEYALVFDELKSSKFNIISLIKVVLCSIAIEITGMIHLWIAARAVGTEISPFIAFIGYVVVVVMLMASPLLKGVGPVELVLTLVLQQFGFDPVTSLSITLVFRFFEFILPLTAGVFSMLTLTGNIVYRILPPIFILSLGTINILSVLTPPIAQRLHLLHNFLPSGIIQGSNFVVIVAGIILILTAASLFKGYRNAWTGTLILVIISMIAHLSKAIDVEEAGFAGFTAVLLLITRKQYHLRPNKKLVQMGIQTALLTVVVIFLYGITGFYFLEKRHFHQDFSLISSLYATLTNFLVIGNSNLKAVTTFGNEFLASIRIAGTLSLGFLMITLVIPVIKRKHRPMESVGIAKDLVNEKGKSSLDYFKTYYDKSIFLTSSNDSFISYKINGDFAIVLEDPVSSDNNAMMSAIREFDLFCLDNNLIPVYFRVPEESIHIYRSFKKKAILIGQEAVADIRNFTLDGRERKGLRNSVHKMEKEGYVCKIYEPPIKDGILQKLKYVSDEWLRDGKKESIFSQGIFLWDELKQHRILTAENEDEKIVAFINLIPDYVPGEGTYDLQRRLSDSPNGVLEYLQIKMFEYFKNNGYQSVNLGLVPMSGIGETKHPAERTIRFLYEQLPQFAHYKGLRFYKEKFDPTWVNKYLVYNNSYDLLRIPAAINSVMKV